MKFFNKIYIGGFLFFLPLVAAAQSGSNNAVYVSGSNNSFVGFDNPLKAQTICQALKLFLTALLTLAVPVAVLFLVYAGFRFVWARGNPTALKTARTNLLYVVIGIAVFLGAWVLGQVIANTLNQLGTSAGSPNPQIGQCQ
jgi:hypothetical protein